MAGHVCSARLLETFVRDLVGHDVAKAIRGSFQPRTKTIFGTRTSLTSHRGHARLLMTQTTPTSTIHHESFVPFDFETRSSHPKPSSGTTSPQPVYSPPRPEEQSRETLDNAQPAVELTFHKDQLELPFDKSSLLSTQQIQAQHQTTTNPLSTNNYVTDLVAPSRYVDDIAVPFLEAQHEQGLVRDLGHALDRRLNIEPPSRTRQDRRKERKVRRTQGKLHDDSQQGNEEKHSVRAMLSTVEAETEAKLAPRTIRTAQSITAQRLERKTKDRKSQRSPAAGEKRITSSSPAWSKRKADTLKPLPGAEKPRKEPWQVQKAALENKFREQAWTPRKRISPDALAGIKALHASQPTVYTTPMLADHFKVSPDAIRRILKSKWQPDEEAMEDRRKRWEKRGERKWSEMVEQGIRPPKKWREMGVGRAAKGDVPEWKKKSKRQGSLSGERWIEQPDADLFTRAADAMADAEGERSLSAKSIAERIL